MTAYQRRKGHTWERKVAAKLRAVMPGAEIKRGLQTREGSAVPDIVCPVFWPECKIGQRPNIHAAYRQAADHCPKTKMALAVTKRDRQPALVTLSLDDFLDLVGQWWSLTNA